MNSLKSLLVTWLGGVRNGHETAKARTRRGLVCEALEGRQLLHGAWSGPGAFAAPHVEKVGGGGLHDLAPPNLSAAALADLKTLQTDTQTLQAEIKAKVPSSLFDAVKADADAIQKALGATGKGWNWNGPDHLAHGFMTGSDPSIGVYHARPAFHGTPPGPNIPMFGTTLPAALVTKLEASGVTAAQVARYEADAKAVQTAVAAVDPTLMAKIEADRQAFQKDVTPTAMHFDHIKMTGATTKVG